MKFGRYLALMASTWVLAALGVAAFTLLVDAIGISPVRVAIAGFNAWKPLRQALHERASKQGIQAEKLQQAEQRLQ